MCASHLMRLLKLTCFFLKLFNFCQCTSNQDDIFNLMFCGKKKHQTIEIKFVYAFIELQIPKLQAAFRLMRITFNLTIGRIKNISIDRFFLSMICGVTF